jgi:hypothetical protein
MRGLIILGCTLALGSAVPALAQESDNSPPVQEVQTPVGEATVQTNTYNVGDGTLKTTTVTPSGNATVQPYVGSTTYNPGGNQQSNTAYHAGVSIQFGSGSSNSSSNSSSSSGSSNNSGSRH